MYNVHVPFPSLWSIDGSFERRRWPPRVQTATVVDEEKFQFELTLLDDKRPAIEMHWVVAVDVNGEFRLLVDWTHLRQDDLSN